MPIDPQYLDAIKQSEGFVPQASWDYKQYSNGYGTKALYPGEVIDKATAEQRFNDRIAEAEAHVNSVAPNAPPGVKAALTSLTFNAGPGWSQAGLGDLVRAGDWQGAAERFQQYNKAGGQVNPGLVKRRGSEAAWFNAPPTDAPQAPPLSPPVTVATAPVGPPQPQLPQAVPATSGQQPSAPLNLLAFQKPQVSAPAGMPAFQWSPQAQPQPQMASIMPQSSASPMSAPQIAYPQRRPSQLVDLSLFQTRLRPGFSLKG